MKRYSLNETRLRKLLLNIKCPLTASQIAFHHYCNRQQPKFPSHAVIAMLTNLDKKMRYNRDAYKIIKSEQRGPYPITFAMEKRSMKTGGKSR